MCSSIAILFPAPLLYEDKTSAVQFNRLQRPINTSHLRRSPNSSSQQLLPIIRNISGTHQHHENPTQLSLSIMNASSHRQASLDAVIDMHIGSIFDEEKYLELERKIFQSKPRSTQSTPPTPPKRTVFGRVVHSATKFACWLDDALKAPFRAISSKITGLSTNTGSGSGGIKPESKPRQKVTPSPQVDSAESVKSRDCSCRETHEQQAGNEIWRDDVKSGPASTSQDRFDVIRTGHVKELVKKYEYWSSTSHEGLIGEPRNGQTSFEPRSR